LPRSEPLPTTTTGHYTICCKKNLSLALLKMGKSFPETCWADLGDQENCYCCISLVSILPYLHWWCTVKHKSSFKSSTFSRCVH